ncbi:MAG: ankyrin repeat domain-containing protein [Planctomycetota bacterium]|jgi:hypothetical protein
MKLSMPLKVSIVLNLLIAGVVVTCLLVRTGKPDGPAEIFRTGSPEERAAAVDAILQKGDEGLKILARQLGGGMEEAKFLAEHWKRYNEPIEQGQIDYPLHVAATCGFLDAAELLLNKGADVDPGRSGYTPLMMAAMCGDEEMCELLMRGGADINARTKLFLTPLDYAIEKNMDNTARLLRALGGKSGSEIHEEMIKKK